MLQEKSIVFTWVTIENIQNWHSRCNLLVYPGLWTSCACWKDSSCRAVFVITPGMLQIYWVEVFWPGWWRLLVGNQWPVDSEPCLGLIWWCFNSGFSLFPWNLMWIFLLRKKKTCQGSCKKSDVFLFGSENSKIKWVTKRFSLCQFNMTYSEDGRLKGKGLWAILGHW